MTERAPQRLRERIEASRPSPAARARRRAGYSGALAGALAAVILALVLVLPGGTPGAPSLSEAAGLASLGPNAPAPAPDPDHPRVNLGPHLGNVYFPNWGARFGWRATGQRSDRIGGRLALTVYYDAGHGRRVAYTIVDAPALAVPRSSSVAVYGIAFHTLTIGHRLIVTWERGGRTCVLSGAGVPVSVLRTLAAWHGSTGR